MKFLFFSFFLIFSTNSLATSESLSRALKLDVGRDKEDHDSTCAQIKSKPIKWGLMILASAKTSADAEKKAKEISEKVNVPFESHSFSDDLYKPRVSNYDDKDHLTVEISSKYNNLTPNLFIVVGGVVSIDSKNLFSKYKSAIPDSYIKFTKVKGDKGGYGATSGCIDSKVFVLARTVTWENADLIATEISKAVGIAYSSNKTAASSDSYFSTRKEPFPKISVESESTYGDMEYKGYLIVGAELTGAEKAKSALLKRYEKFVPRAFIIRHTHHVCGA